MARDIYIKPSDDDALRAVYQSKLESAKQGGPLEQLLGYASKIPGAVKAERKAEGKRAALSQFMATKGESGVTPESVEETLHLAQAKKALREPDIETLRLEWQKNLSDASGYRVVDIDGVKYIERKSGRPGAAPMLQPLAFQKGDKETIKETADAITTFGNIDPYFDRVEIIPSEWKRRYATSGAFGSEFAFPAVAALEKQMLNIYQFSRGGKQLTAMEKADIRELAKSAAYGPEEREMSRTKFKEMVGRNVEALLQSKALGGSQEFLRQEFEGAKGTTTPAPKKRMSKVQVNKNTKAKRTVYSDDGGKTWKPE